MKHLVLILIIFVSVRLYGQNETQFSQTTKTHKLINPAYNGSVDGISGLFMYRNQWIGMEGSPVYQALNAYVPLKSKGIGLGLNALNESWTFYKNTDAYATVTYYIPMKNDSNRLSFGLQAGINSSRIETRKVVSDNNQSYTFEDPYYSPNFGFGVYYNTTRFFIGLSVPGIFAKKSLQPDSVNISFESSISTKNFQTHLYTGYIFNIATGFMFKPSVLFRYLDSSPLQIDINGSLLINEKIWVGVGWRIKDALIFMTEFQIINNISLGYSYDYTLSDLSNISDGTHEISLSFDFRKKRTTTIRYF